MNEGAFKTKRHEQENTFFKIGFLPPGGGKLLFFFWSCIALKLFSELP